MSLLEERLDLERYVMFLREISRYPRHYKKIVVQNYIIDDKDTFNIKSFFDWHMEFEFSKICKHDYVWNILALFIKWDVVSLKEDDEEIWFCFSDDSKIGKEKFACVGCYKAEWEAEEAK